jgi:hypothetical protein
VVQLAVEAHKKAEERGASEAERLFKLLAGGVALATMASAVQLLLSRLFARAPTAPPTAPAPLFDYVVEIYVDKVVVTSSDGTTTTLSTVADLNNWLKNVRDKRIAVYSYTSVGSPVVLTRNMYVFAKGWYSYIGLAETVVLYFFGDYVERIDNEPEGAYTDISGSQVLIMNAGTVVLQRPAEVNPLKNMTVVCIGCEFVFMNGFSGGVVALSSTVESIVAYSSLDVLVADSWLFIVYGTTVGRVLCIRATFASLSNVTFAGYSAHADVGMPFVVTLKPSGQAGDTATIAVPPLTVASDYTVYSEIEVNVYVAQKGSPAVRLDLTYLEPAGDRVSYTVDPTTATITVKNNTDSDITVYVRVRLLYTGTQAGATRLYSESNTGASPDALINIRRKEKSIISAQLNV